MSGTKPPESCIFGQFLNIGAFLLSVLFYIKYKQVLHILTSVKWIQYPIKVADFYPSHPRQKHLKKVNTISLGLGMVGALGVRFFWIFSRNIWILSKIVKRVHHIYCSMVGNFQETTVSSVHFIGASLCFGLGTIYIWIQVWLTWKVLFIWSLHNTLIVKACPWNISFNQG